MSAVDYIVINAWHGDFSEAAILVLLAGGHCERCGYKGVGRLLTTFVLSYYLSIISFLNLKGGNNVRVV